ncbi:MAG TPA: hypothetical protein VGC36_04755 [Rhizomicrobium sp.]
MWPESIAEIADRTTDRHGSFDRAVREFIDCWQTAAPERRPGMLADEPGRIDRRHDSYLAALAEHLALSARIDVPEWTEAPDRFLSEPFFSGGLESLKATLLIESPLAFRRRLIFISADALSRPHHGLEAVIAS